MGVEMCSALFFFPYLRLSRLPPQHDTFSPSSESRCSLSPPRRERERVASFFLLSVEIISRASFLPEIVATARRMDTARFVPRGERRTRISFFSHLISIFNALVSLGIAFITKFVIIVVVFPALLVITRGFTERILNLDNASFILYARLFSSRSSLPFSYVFAT